MKQLLVIFLLIASLRLQAQVSPAQVKAVTDSAINSVPRFVADQTGNAFSQSQMFKEVDPTGFDLLNANLSFTDKDQVQKIGFSPLRLIPNWYNEVLSNLRLNAANNSGGLTAGLSLGYDGSALESRRVDKKFKNFQVKANALLPVLRGRGATESIAEYTSYYRQVYAKALATLIEDFDLERLQHVWKFAGGYNAQFFPVLNSRNATGNFDSLNYHGFKGHNLFASASYSYANGSLNLSATYNYFNKRKSADSTQTLNRYNGFSFGISKRVIRLVGIDALRKKDYYTNTRFIPAISLGLSYERSNYLGSNYIFAEDNAKKAYVFSPFIDFAIDPAVQFRLIFPLKTTEQYAAGSSGQNLNAIFQLNYKLVNLK